MMEAGYMGSNAGGSRELKFVAACDNGKELIVSDADGKGIFRINKKNKESDFVTMIEKGDRFTYQSIEQINNEIFLFPYDFGKTDIAIYYLDREETEFICLPKKNRFAGDNYRPVKKVENEVWLFPVNITNDLIIFHLDTKKADTVRGWSEALKNTALNLENWYLLGRYRRVGEIIEEQGIIYHTVLGTNILMAIHKESHKVTTYRIPVNMEFAGGLDYDGKNFWISGKRNQGIVAWNPQDGVVHCYHEIFIGYEPLYNNHYINWYQNIICGKGYLWLIPVTDNKLLKMNYETGEIENVAIFPEAFCIDKGWKKNSEIFSYIVKKNKMVDLYPFASNLLIHLDMEKDIMLDDYEKLFLPKGWGDEEIARYELNNGYESLRGKASVLLDFYIKSVVQKGAGRMEQNNGELIWGKLRDRDEKNIDLGNREIL